MKLYRSPEHMTGLALLGFAMSAVAIWVAFVTYRTEGPGSFHFAVCAFGGPLFFFTSIFIILKIFDKRPAIEFSDAGLSIPEASPDQIAWHDVLDARISKYRRHKLIELQISPQSQAFASLRWLMRVNGAFMGKRRGYIYFAMHGFPASAEWLLEEIEKWRAKALASESGEQIANSF